MELALLCASIAILLCGVSSLPTNISCDLKVEILACKFFPPESRGATNGSLGTKYFVHFEKHVSTPDTECIGFGKSSCVYSHDLKELQIKIMDRTSTVFIFVKDQSLRNQTFSVRPCEHEFISFSFLVTARNRSLLFQWNITAHVSRDLEKYQLRATCLSLFDNKTHQQIFSSSYFEEDIRVLEGLHPFTRYRCSLEANHLEGCKSRWRSAGVQLVQTLADVPSSGPVFHSGMYQVEDTYCYLYFLPVPLAARNDHRVDTYRCRDRPALSTRTLTLRADCPPGASFKCALEAHNSVGWSSGTTSVAAAADTAPAELQLWHTGAGEVAIRVLPPARGRARILVCTCGTACGRRHPDCVAMREERLQEGETLAIDLRTERAAVLVKNGSLSAWEGCVANDTRETSSQVLAALVAGAQVRTFCRRDVCVEVTISADLLRCRFRPLLSLFTRIDCGDGATTDRQHKRVLGRRNMIISATVDRGCALLLSHDGHAFRLVHGMVANPLGMILGVTLGVLVVLVAVLGLVFVCVRRRLCERLREWKRKNLETGIYESPVTQGFKGNGQQAFTDDYESCDSPNNENQRSTSIMESSDVPDSSDLLLGFQSSGGTSAPAYIPNECDNNEVRNTQI